MISISDVVLKNCHLFITDMLRILRVILIIVTRMWCERRYICNLYSCIESYPYLDKHNQLCNIVKLQQHVSCYERISMRSRHRLDVIFITGNTEDCDFDNFRLRQWWKFR